MRVFLGAVVPPPIGRRDNHSRGSGCPPIRTPIMVRAPERRSDSLRAEV